MGRDKEEMLDVTGKESDVVEVEVQERMNGRERVLYVHVNGITILRICRIEPKNLTLLGRQELPSQEAPKTRN